VNQILFYNYVQVLQLDYYKKAFVSLLLYVLFHETKFMRALNDVRK